MTIDPSTSKIFTCLRFLRIYYVCIFHVFFTTMFILQPISRSANAVLHVMEKNVTRLLFINTLCSSLSSALEGSPKNPFFHFCFFERYQKK